MANFKRGDIICDEKGLDPISNLIFFFQSLDDFYTKRNTKELDPDKITHVRLVINQYECIEAVATGVRIVPIVNLKKSWLCVLKDEHRQKLNSIAFDAFINNLDGEGYDFIQLLKFIPYFLSFKLWKPKRNDKLPVCSEIVGIVYDTFGIPVKTPSRITPSDLFNSDLFEKRIKL